jgi:hypothetical protein
MLTLYLTRESDVACCIVLGSVAGCLVTTWQRCPLWPPAKASGGRDTAGGSSRCEEKGCLRAQTVMPLLCAVQIYHAYGTLLAYGPLRQIGTWLLVDPAAGSNRLWRKQ